MIALWRSVDLELPPERIRVLTCDYSGFIQTGFYGRESSILGSNKKCWRSDEIGKEVEINVIYWDYFPELPFFPNIKWIKNLRCRMNPICPMHKVEMYLLAGCHRESGGFLDNYWYCGEKNCEITVPARNREEAERQTILQLKGYQGK